jgi:DNA-binding phage protein
VAIKNVHETHNKSLRDPEVAAEYLKEAIKSEDKSVLQKALRIIAVAYGVEYEHVIGPVGKEFGSPDCDYD